MISPISINRVAAWKSLALVSASSILAVAPAFGESSGDKTLAPVVVTASRFASNLEQSAIGATVISSEEIREAGINNVNEAIRKIGGVYGRQSFNGTQDFSIDLRGFGTNSDQNLVVFVDGIRLSENELSPAVLTSIPIESVERIEIVRGGSSVLYGEGATGGTIQIITKRGVRNGVHGTTVAEVGSFGNKELRASVAKGVDGFSLDANASVQQADNYRDNNATKQKNFSGGAQWASNEGRVGLRLDLARQDVRFPGDLTLSEFQENPRQTKHPDDFGSADTNRYTFFSERHLGALDVAAELSHRDKTTRGVFISAFGTSDSKSDSAMTQFSPRVRHLSDIGEVKNEVVAGIDVARWTLTTNSSFADPTGFIFSSKADASQKSRAVYVRDEIRFGSARIAAGARHEIFDKDFTKAPTAAYSKSHGLNAWDLQAKYALAPSVSLFAKGGQSYRVANADENGFTPIANQPLEPQTSHDLEAGSTLGNPERKVTVRVFRHRLTNEIFFDPTSPNPSTAFFPTSKGANVNLDPTQREGVEIEGSMRLMSAFTLSAYLQHLSAKFTDGPNSGKEMVLVPRNNASLRLNWLPGNGQSANVGLQWVDSQRYGGDFSNTCSARIPSFTTLDARYAMQAGAWEFAVAGTNLTDRSYFTQAFGACQSGIYPDSGRQLKVTARLDF